MPVIHSGGAWYTQPFKLLSRTVNEIIRGNGYAGTISTTGGGVFKKDAKGNYVNVTQGLENESNIVGFLKNLRARNGDSFRLTDENGVERKLEDMLKPGQEFSIDKNMDLWDRLESRYYENTGAGLDDYKFRGDWLAGDLLKTGGVAAAGIVGLKATQMGVSLITGD